MENKYYKVTLEIAAPSKKLVEKMLEGMPHAERIFEETIEDPDVPHFECRIRYDSNWAEQGEHYVFENKWSDEDEWSLDSAFPLVSYENGELVVGKGDMLNYQALTKIRELKHLGIPFRFK